MLKILRAYGIPSFDQFQESFPQYTESKDFEDLASMCHAKLSNGTLYLKAKRKRFYHQTENYLNY